VKFGMLFGTEVLPGFSETVLSDTVWSETVLSGSAG
jgi:hypothetical protein